MHLVFHFWQQRMLWLANGRKKKILPQFPLGFCFILQQQNIICQKKKNKKTHHLSLLNCQSDKNAYKCIPPSKPKANSPSSMKLSLSSSARLISPTSCPIVFGLYILKFTKLSSVVFGQSILVLLLLQQSLDIQLEIFSSVSCTKPSALSGTRFLP